MIPVRCNNHPWMQAFINVSANPFFAVSDVSGRYFIKGLPPGTYTVVADQEQLGQKIATVTVLAKGTVTQDFTYGDGAQK
jgi:tRNA A37 threonylcarbamoyladenosine synthetase subunit TsaC/SUA5/YrdC